MCLLVLLGWSTFTVLCVVVLSTDPGIPHTVTAVRICKGDTHPLYSAHSAAAGLPPFIDEEHKKIMMRNNLRRIVTIFVMIIFVWTSQSRVTRYRWHIFTHTNIYYIRGCPYILSAAITRQGHSECLRTLT